MSVVESIFDKLQCPNCLVKGKDFLKIQYSTQDNKTLCTCSKCSFNYILSDEEAKLAKEEFKEINTNLITQDKIKLPLDFKVEFDSDSLTRDSHYKTIEEISNWLIENKKKILKRRFTKLFFERDKYYNDEQLLEFKNKKQFTIIFDPVTDQGIGQVKKFTINKQDYNLKGDASLLQCQANCIPFIDDTGKILAASTLNGDKFFFLVRGIFGDFYDAVSIELFKAALEKYFEAFNNKSEKELKEQIIELQKKFYSEKYAKILVKGREKEIIFCKKEIEKITFNIEEHNQKLIANIRNLEEQEERIKFLESSFENAFENLKKEWGKILELNGFEKFTIEKDEVIGITTPILITHVFTNDDDEEFKDVGEKTINIGKYKIALNFNTSKVLIDCFNSKNKIDKYPHPHINTDGRPCLGNISEHVAEYVAKFQFSVAFVVLRQFLESYNRLNPYLRLHKWLEQKSEEQKSEEQKSEEQKSEE